MCAWIALIIIMVNVNWTMLSDFTGQAASEQAGYIYMLEKVKIQIQVDGILDTRAMSVNSGTLLYQVSELWPLLYNSHMLFVITC